MKKLAVIITCAGFVIAAAPGDVVADPKTPPSNLRSSRTAETDPLLLKSVLKQVEIPQSKKKPAQKLHIKMENVELILDADPFFEIIGKEEGASASGTWKLFFDSVNARRTGDIVCSIKEDSIAHDFAKYRLYTENSTQEIDEGNSLIVALFESLEMNPSILVGITDLLHKDKDKSGIPLIVGSWKVPKNFDHGDFGRCLIWDGRILTNVYLGHKG